MMIIEKDLTEAKAVIKKFGGQTKLAKLLGTDRRVIWNWTQRGIPKPWKQVLALRAPTENIKLPRGFMQ